MKKVNRTSVQDLRSLTILAAFLFALTALAQAQSISAPSPSSAKSCDDFFSQVLQNPADMSDSDINNFYTDPYTGLGDIAGFSAHSMSDGKFRFTTSASPTSMRNLFYMWSPPVCGTFPVSQPMGARFGARGNDWPEAGVWFNAAMASKYTKLYVRMKHPSVSSPAHAVYVRAERSCDYLTNFDISAPNLVKEGTHVYSFDLPSSLSGSGKAWSLGDVTGLSIEPTQQANTSGEIDWVRMEDAASCQGQNISVPFTFASSAGRERFTFLLDDDADPFTTGYVKRLSDPAVASGSGTLSISDTGGVPPGSYNVLGVLSNDFFTLEKLNPMDFSQPEEVSASSTTISGFTISNGAASGTTGSADDNIFLSLGSSGLNANVYRYLTIRISRSNVSSSDPVRIIFTNGFKDLFPSGPTYQGNGVWSGVDLGVEPGWSNTITNFIVRPAIKSGVPFTLDDVKITSTTTAADPLIVTSSAKLTVNSPPTGSISKPDQLSGEQFQPWNMNQGDLVVFDNLRSDTDPAYPAESFSSFLPDVRLVDGLRGDFFKGTNELGNGDPNNFSTFPGSSNASLIDANKFKILCYKLNVDGINNSRTYFSLRDGYHVRVIALRSDGVSMTSDDVVNVYPRFASSRWGTYCLDLSTTPDEGTGQSGKWSGSFTSFRVDPTELFYHPIDPNLNPLPGGAPLSVPYYFDYIKLHSYPTANGSYSFVYSASDPDGGTPNVTFFYSPNRGTSGGTRIQDSELQCSGRICTWNTSSVPNGSYFIYATASDGTNSSSFQSTTKLVVDHGSAVSAQDPILSVQSPTNGQQVCGNLQVKGYALMPRLERVAGVQVFIDGAFKHYVDPTSFSSAARSAHPSLDSSNTGFNDLLDVSGLSNGNHTVRIVAYSSDGRTASAEATINRTPSGCSDPIVDPDPSGVPAGADLSPAQPGANLSFSATIQSADVLYDVQGLQSGPIACNGVRIMASDTQAGLRSSPVTLYTGPYNTSTGRALLRSLSLPKILLADKKGKKKTPNPQLFLQADCGAGSETKQVTLNLKSFRIKKAPSKKKKVKFVKSTKAWVMNLSKTPIRSES
jgi:hypothetical protein